MFLIPHISLTYLSHRLSCCSKWHHFVIGYVRMILVLETKSIDGLAQTDPVANGVLQRWKVLLHDANHLVAVQRLRYLSFTGLTKA